MKSQIKKYRTLYRYKKSYQMLADTFAQVGFEYDFHEDKLAFFSGKSQEVDMPEIVEDFHRKLRKQQLRITLSEEEFDELCADAEKGSAFQTELQCGVKEGGWNWFQMIYSVIYDEERIPVRLFGCLVDAQKQHQTQEKLVKMGHYDMLTGIHNRSGAEERMQEALGELDKYTENAFLLMDVDRFKQMNDRCGHLCGDDVLKSLGRNMQDIFQGDTILSRWGGDEFILFVRGPGADRELLELRIEELRRRMKQYQYDGTRYPVELSIGGIVPGKGMSLESLFRQADEVLYRVKEGGRDNYIIENALME